MGSFKSMTELFEVKGVWACGTSALREAENGKRVIERIKEATGIKIDILDGKREAEIIYTCHVAEKLNHGKNYLYVDVGGGSTEVTLFAKGKMIYSNSFPVGTVRMLLEKVSMHDWERMKDAVKTLRRDFYPIVAIGTGGNINKILKIVSSKEKSVEYKELKRLYEDLLAMNLEERIKKFAFHESRADVIVPAAKIYLSIMKWADINEIYVPKLGLADGMVNFLYEQEK